MRDIVLVKEGEEELFVDQALKLGYNSLTLIYEKSGKKAFSSEKISIRAGLVNKSGKEENLVLGTRISQIPKNSTLLVLNEFDTEKDFVHQRRSGFNQVQAKFCKDKNIILLFAYAPLQEKSLEEQSTILGRIKQNILLCKKYGVSFEMVSLARKPEEMRHSKDVQALLRTLSSN